MSEAINTSQYKGTEKIHADIIEMPVRCRKVTKWCDRMTLVLRALVLKTLLGPTWHINDDAWRDLTHGDDRWVARIPRCTSERKVAKTV